MFNYIMYQRKTIKYL